ncbi:MAG: SusC/RagA family TonB-linked outer membrane protein [Bacteroidota bacterium]
MRSKFKWIFTLLLALTVQFSFAQEKTITGVVSDASGPLPGVNVVVKGTTKGVSTGFDGTYSVKAKEGDVLVYSFMGMREISKVVGSSNVINTILQDDSKILGEVVVTALGVKKATKALSSASQNVKGDQLTEARESNIVNALSGKISGVQVTNSSGAVGGSSRIVLRGASTISGNNQALFVVDGVPIDNTNRGSATSGGGVDLPNGVASLNPDDIESINVLKGPAAAAIYGIRGSAGVIVVTTKSGKRKGGKFEVGFNSNMTFANPLLLPNYQNSYGQGSTSDYFEFVDGQGGGYNDGVDESWGPQLDAGLEFVQWDSYKVGGAPLPWISQKDNIKNFYDTGINVSNTLSIATGNEDMSIRFSIGNSEEKGMVPTTEFKKFNVGFNGSAKLGEKFSVTGGATFFRNNSDNLPPVGYTASNVVQQFIWSARNVKYTDLRDWRNLPLTGGNGTPLNWNNNFQNNPYWSLDNNKTGFIQDRIIGNFGANYKFTKNLSINGKLMMDTYNQSIDYKTQIGTYETALATSGLNGFYGVSNTNYTEINAEALLTYDKRLSEDFNLNLNVGANNMKRTRNTFTGFLNGGIELPGLFTLSNAKSGTTPAIDSDLFDQRINSLFGFGQISYKDFAFLDFSARNDWASVLPASNNSFLYPSVTGSLVLSDMLGFSDSKFNYLKLRGGWSKVGGPGPLAEYSTNSSYTIGNTGLGSNSNVPNVRWNPNIKPESTTGIEIGLDANAFNNRLRLAATYYDQKSNDLIVNAPISSGSGFTSSWENIGEMRNKGFEVQLGATVLKKDSFSFDVDVNFAKNENQVVSLGALESVTLGGQWGMELQAVEGQPYGVIAGFPLLRNENGDVIYENGLPVTDNSRLVNLGNITPDWTGGVNFTLKYKGFDLGTLIDAKMGGDVYSMSYMWGRYAGTLEESLIGREGGIVGNGVVSNGAGGWVPNNEVVTAKEFNQYAYSYSNFTETGIFDASYVKLRQINLGYSLPKKWLQGSFIQDLKVSVVGRNLALLYKKAPHIDPETAFSNTNGEQGQEFGQIPSARTYGFNINVKF